MLLEMLLDTPAIMNECVVEICYFCSFFGVSLFVSFFVEVCVCVYVYYTIYVDYLWLAQGVRASTKRGTPGHGKVRV